MNRRVPLRNAKRFGVHLCNSLWEGFMSFALRAKRALRALFARGARSAGSVKNGGLTLRKALAEIYTMHSFAPLSNLKIVKNCWIVCCFLPNLSSCTRRAPICFGEKGREKRIAYPRVRSGAQCSCAPAALYLIVRSNEAQENQVHEFAI